MDTRRADLNNSDGGINQDLKTFLFSDNLYHELTSDESIEHEAESLSISPFRNKIFISNLTDADYANYYDKHINSLNISNLGIQRVSRYVIANIFSHFSRSHFTLRTLGLDGLDYDSLALIYSHIISASVYNHPVRVTCINIPGEWQRRFDSLNAGCNQALKGLLFSTPYYELTSNTENVHNALKALVSQSVTRDKIYFFKLTDEEYDEHYDNLIEGMNISILGLQRLTRHVVENIFKHVTRSVSTLRVLGLDGLDDETITVIYSHIISAYMRGAPVEVRLGPNIPSDWQRKFDSLKNPAMLDFKAKKLFLVWLKVRTDERNAYATQTEEFNKLIASLDARLHESATKETNQTQQLLSSEETLKTTQGKLQEAEKQSKELSSKLSKAESDAQVIKTELDNKNTQISNKDTENEKLRKQLIDLEELQKRDQEKLKALSEELKFENSMRKFAEGSFVVKHSELSVVTSEFNSIAERYKNAIAPLMRKRIHEVSIENYEQETKEDNSDSVDIACDLRTKSNKSHKKPKLSKKQKTLQTANILLDLTTQNQAQSQSQSQSQSSSSTIPETGMTIEVEEVKQEISSKLQKFLVNLLSGKLDIKKTEPELEKLITYELNNCEKVFANRQGFNKIDDKDLTSIFYYLCYLICNFHKNKQVATQPVSNSNEEINSQAEDELPLLSTINNLLDSLYSISEANMFLRVDRINLENNKNQSQNQVQALQTQLTSAQSDANKLKPLRLRLKNAETKSANLDQTILKQNFALVNTNSFLARLMSECPFISQELYLLASRLQIEINKIEEKTPVLMPTLNLSPSIHSYYLAQGAAPNPSGFFNNSSSSSSILPGLNNLNNITGSQYAYNSYS